MEDEDEIERLERELKEAEENITRGATEPSSTTTTTTRPPVTEPFVPQPSGQDEESEEQTEEELRFEKQLFEASRPNVRLHLSNKLTLDGNDILPLYNLFFSVDLSATKWLTNIFMDYAIGRELKSIQYIDPVIALYYGQNQGDMPVLKRSAVTGEGIAVIPIIDRQNDPTHWTTLVLYKTNAWYYDSMSPIKEENRENAINILARLDGERNLPHTLHHRHPHLVPQAASWECGYYVYLLAKLYNETSFNSFSAYDTQVKEKLASIGQLDRIKIRQLMLPVVKKLLKEEGNKKEVLPTQITPPPVPNVPVVEESVAQGLIGDLLTQIRLKDKRIEELEEEGRRQGGTIEGQRKNIVQLKKENQKLIQDLEAEQAYTEKLLNEWNSGTVAPLRAYLQWSVPDVSAMVTKARLSNRLKTRISHGPYTMNLRFTNAAGDEMSTTTVQGVSLIQDLDLGAKVYATRLDKTSSTTSPSINKLNRGWVQPAGKVELSIRERATGREVLAGTPITYNVDTKSDVQNYVLTGNAPGNKAIRMYMHGGEGGMRVKLITVEA